MTRSLKFTWSNSISDSVWDFFIEGLKKFQNKNSNKIAEVYDVESPFNKSTSLEHWRFFFYIDIIRRIDSSKNSLNKLSSVSLTKKGENLLKILKNDLIQKKTVSQDNIDPSFWNLLESYFYQEVIQYRLLINYLNKTRKKKIEKKTLDKELLNFSTEQTGTLFFDNISLANARKSAIRFGTLNEKEKYVYEIDLDRPDYFTQNIETSVIEYLSEQDDNQAFTFDIINKIINNIEKYTLDFEELSTKPNIFEEILDILAEIVKSNVNITWIPAQASLSIPSKFALMKLQ